LKVPNLRGYLRFLHRPNVCNGSKAAISAVPEERTFFWFITLGIYPGELPNRSCAESSEAALSAGDQSAVAEAARVALAQIKQIRS
jgi:hypothetical protein